MKVKNRLKEILEELGIKSMVPTPTLLTQKLGGMSPIRFNKLVHNAGPKDIAVHEVQLITNWLSSLTGQPKSALQLVETTEPQEGGAL